MIISCQWYPKMHYLLAILPRRHNGLLAWTCITWRWCRSSYQLSHLVAYQGKKTELQGSHKEFTPQFSSSWRGRAYTLYHPMTTSSTTHWISDKLYFLDISQQWFVGVFALADAIFILYQVAGFHLHSNTCFADNWYKVCFAVHLLRMERVSAHEGVAFFQVPTCKVYFIRSTISVYFCC